MIEIDAASNRGIDEMRELRDKIRFAPSSARKKVYIIDEVHMLTKEAFNALLKTLEEPPAHAVFILATTELHKVPVTIASRCQTFQFKKASQADLVHRLGVVAKSEGFEIEPAGVTFLARLAGGSYRDALSLLDQIASNHSQGTIDVTTIQAVLGLASEERILVVLEAVAAGKREETIAGLESLEVHGLDPEQFAQQLIEAGRTMLHLSLGARVETSETERDRWEGLASQFTTQELITLIEELVSHRQLMKQSVVAVLPLEVALIATIERRGQMAEDRRQEIEDRSQKTEVRSKETEEVREGNSGAENGPLNVIKDEEEKLDGDLKQPEVDGLDRGTSDQLVVGQEVQPPIPAIQPQEKVETGSQVSKSEIKDSQLATWNTLLERIRDQNMSVHGLLQQAEFGGIDGNRLVIRVPYKFAADRLADRKHRALVEKVAQDIHGQALVLHCEVCVRDHVDHSPGEVTVSPELVDAAAEVFGIDEA